MHPHGDVQEMEMCFSEIQNGRHGSISFFFRSQKNQKLSRKLKKNYNHIPYAMEMCM